MPALDRLKAADASQESTSERLSTLTSSLDAVLRQLAKQTEVVNKLTSFVKISDEQNDLLFSKLSEEISQLREQPSTPLPVDEQTSRRLSEIEKTLSAVASLLSASEVVKLPDGSTVTHSDVQAHAMMTRIEQQLATTARSSDELAEAVRKRGVVKVDTAGLQEYTVKVLDTRLAKAVAPSVDRLAMTLDGFEQRVAVVGADRVEQAAVEVEKVVAKATDVVAAVHKAEQRVAALEARVGWTAAGRLALALLPLAVVLLVLGGLTMGAAHALGLGPLLGWAWASFGAASAWWAKLLIALATLSCVAGFGWGVWAAGRRLAEVYRAW